MTNLFVINENGYIKTAGVLLSESKVAYVDDLTVVIESAARLREGAHITDPEAYPIVEVPLQANVELSELCGMSAVELLRKIAG